MDRERRLDFRESGLADGEKGHASRETGLDVRETGLDLRETGFVARESGLDCAASGLRAHETGLDADEAGLEGERAAAGAHETGLGAQLSRAGMDVWRADAEVCVPEHDARAHDLRDGRDVAGGRILGFATEFRYANGPDGPWYASLSLDGHHLHLSTFAGDSAPRAAVYFYVDDVDALFGRFVAAGLRVPRRPESPVEEGPLNQTWGMREVHVRDPDGNMLRFGSPIPPADARREDTK